MSSGKRIPAQPTLLAMGPCLTQAVTWVESS